VRVVPGWEGVSDADADGNINGLRRVDEGIGVPSA